MSKDRITIAQAVAQASAARGHLRAKGFARASGSGDLHYTRLDAELYFDMSAGRWVCDVFTTSDRARGQLLTRKAAPMLVAVLKSVL